MKAVYVVELECLWCGLGIGDVRLMQERDPIPLEWLRLRCQTCGGQPIRGDMQRRTMEVPLADWPDLYAGRTGRPPKWLVAQRRARLEVA